MPEARSLIDINIAKHFRVLPIGLYKLSDREVLSLAHLRERNEELEAALRFATGKEVKLVSVDAEVLDQALLFAYQGDQAVLEKAVGSLRAAPPPISIDKVSIKFRDSEGEVGKFLVSLVDYAVAQAASDIHLCPRLEGSFVQIRVNGKLLTHDEAICSTEKHRQLVGRIKVLASMDPTVRGLPQDGSFKVDIGSRTVQIRVSSLPTVHGEKIALRLLGMGREKALSELGYPEQVLGWMKEVIQLKQGYILFSGPTGSGKTTSMYALLQTLVGQGLNLLTLEDPVELEVEGVSQTSICESTGLNFAIGLKSILRQDPDAILLGEIRDAESAKIAFQAALSGHLLLSSVHARNVFEIFTRLENLGVSKDLLEIDGSVLVSQRLIPTLCQKCKVIDLENSNRLGFDVYKGVGCGACDYAGYGSRVLAIEALKIGKSADNYYSMADSLKELLKTGWLDCGQFDRYTP